jgi:hypothetical protein
MPSSFPSLSWRSGSAEEDTVRSSRASVATSCSEDHRLLCRSWQISSLFDNGTPSQTRESHGRTERSSLWHLLPASICLAHDDGSVERGVPKPPWVKISEDKDRSSRFRFRRFGYRPSAMDRLHTWQGLLETLPHRFHIGSGPLRVSLPSARSRSGRLSSAYPTGSDSTTA